MNGKQELDVLLEEAGRYVAERRVGMCVTEQAMAIGEALSTPESREEILRRVEIRLRAAARAKRHSKELRLARHVFGWR